MPEFSILPVSVIVRAPDAAALDLEGEAYSMDALKDKGITITEITFGDLNDVEEIR